ncbi:hypothetical protein TNCV_4041841 [Trichonephila clavipes]|nr:hypothetical protein TNCV_4041841 [Trichonephila clavipes]
MTFSHFQVDFPPTSDDSETVLIPRRLVTSYQPIRRPIHKGQATSGLIQIMGYGMEERFVLHFPKASSVKTF